MDVLTIVLILGVSGVNFVMSEINIEKIYMDQEQCVKQYKKPGHWSYSKEEFYFANTIDLTDEFQYDKWDDFLRDFKYFKSHPFSVSFRRDDGEGGVTNRTKLLRNYDLHSAIRYDYDIENIFREPLGYQSIKSETRATTPERFLFWTLDRDFIHLNSMQVFFQNIQVGLSYHKCLIKVALQQYVKNGHLMVRAVYYVKLYSLWSAVGSTVDIHSGDYAGFYGVYS